MSKADTLWTKLRSWIRKMIDKAKEDTQPAPGPTPGPKPQPQPDKQGVDALPWDSIHWQGGNHSHVGRQALPVKVLRSAVIQGGIVRLDYDQTDDWGLLEHTETDKDGKVTKWHSYARLCAFSDHIDGALRGAHFDWLSVDNEGRAQKSKTLANIYDGYLYGAQTPPKGARLWFAVLSNDGKLRTNLIEAQYK